MTFKAAIFDMDGTLLDTLADIGNVVNQVLKANGFPTHPLANYRYYMGDGPRKLILRALPPEAAQQADVVQTCFEGYITGYDQRLNDETRIFDGIGELLDRLTDRGIRLAVLTNKRHDLAQACTAQFLNRWSFAPVLGFREHVPPKPDPAGALEIARQLAIPPAECLFIGDSDVDMATSRAAGMYGAGALWGYRTADELQAAGADVLLEHPSELLQLL